MENARIHSQHDANRSTLTISVSGVFNFDSIAEFRSAYEGYAPPPSNVVVDMRHVESIDSAALGMLLQMQRVLELDRQHIRIINAPADVRRIFDITHFDQKFSIE